MLLLSADPRVTRSSNPVVAASSSAAGTTRLTRPQSRAVAASMTSPDSAISAARFLPTFLAIATIGVWQNQPPLPPGAAKPALSLATARSADATSWQPAAVARPCTRATTGCGTCCISVISSVQVHSSERTAVKSAPATSAKSCPALNTGPLPASTTPSASLSPTSRNASISSCMCRRDKALRRCGLFIVMVAKSSDRSSRMCSNSACSNSTGLPPFASEISSPRYRLTCHELCAPRLRASDRQARQLCLGLVLPEGHELRRADVAAAADNRDAAPREPLRVAEHGRKRRRPRGLDQVPGLFDHGTGG